MCGIWGYKTNDYKTLNKEWIKDIINKADERGGHSYGFYGIKSNGEHVTFKEEGRARTGLIMEMIKNCVVVIGQSRLATSGKINLFNSQPLQTKDNVIVHNGNILDYKNIMNKYNYTPHTELDTEAIIPLLNNHKLKDISIKGSFLHLKLKEYDWSLKYYSNGLPLIKVKEHHKTKIINEYYCSKKWLGKY